MSVPSQPPTPLLTLLGARKKEFTRNPAPRYIILTKVSTEHSKFFFFILIGSTLIYYSLLHSPKYEFALAYTSFKQHFLSTLLHAKNKDGASLRYVST